MRMINFKCTLRCLLEIKTLNHHLPRMDNPLFGYLDCIRVEKIISREGGGDFNVATEGLRESWNVSIFHEYHETVVDTTQYTIKEAISNKNYRENECWINALIDTYQGTYLTQEK